MSTLSTYVNRWSEFLASRPRWLLAAAAVLLLVQIGPYWYSAPDSACYLSMGRSFWNADGPLRLNEGYKAFAVGYSLLISPLFWISERPFILIGCVHFLLAIVIAAGAYRWASAYGRNAAVFAVVFTLMHSCFYLYFRKPLSEMAYMAALYWTVIVLDRVRTATEVGERRRYAVLGIIMLLATLNVRHNGVLLAPGFAVALCWHAWRSGAGLGRAVLLSVFTLALAVGLFQYERYLDDRWIIEGHNMTHWQWMDSKEGSRIGHYLEGVRLQMLDFLRMLVPGALKTHIKTPSWLTPNVFLSIAATVPVVYGYWLLLRRRTDVMLCTVPFFLAINVMYSNDQAGRYTLPLLPVIGVGLWVLLERTRIAPARVLMPLLILQAAAGIGYWTAVDLPRVRENDRRWQDLDALTAEIDADRNRVAVRDVTLYDLERLFVSLDRYVYDLDREAKAARTDDMRWIIAAQSTAVPAGFECVDRRGAFQLLKHAPPKSVPILASGSR